MCLISLILLVAGFFFPPAWLALAGIGIYWYASRKSRRDEAVEKRVRRVVLARQNHVTFPDLYFEAARAHAIAKGGGTGGEEDSASVTMVIEGTPYFVVFTRGKRSPPRKDRAVVAIQEAGRREGAAWPSKCARMATVR